MRKHIFFLLLVTLTILSCSHVKIPPSLRQGIKVDQKIISKALGMQEQGWEYIMPQPKSPQAGWGNSDGRTTWYNGYWVNGEISSSKMPIFKDGIYVGNNVNISTWRRGGAPRRPL